MVTWDENLSLVFFILQLHQKQVLFLLWHLILICLIPCLLITYHGCIALTHNKNFIRIRDKGKAMVRNIVVVPKMLNSIANILLLDPSPNMRKFFVDKALICFGCES